MESAKQSKRTRPAAAARDSYIDLLARLPRLAASAPLTLCGMGACVDARVSMHDMAGLLDVTAPPLAVALAARLIDRAARGVGGEFFVDWPDGPRWLAAHVPVDFTMGGTGPQAAWTLAAVGAPALVALQDRSAHMLRCLDARLTLAESGRAVPAPQVRATGPARPDIFIFEYVAGRPVGDVVPPRSSRVIVRFSNHGLEHDADFDRLSVERANEAGAGLLSGFSNVPAADLDAETARCGALALAWRARGVATVHLELAGYDSIDLGERVLAGMRRAVTSVGMSQSELQAMNPGSDLSGDALPTAMCELGERLGIERVCIHADHWAATATRRDPAVEHEALMAGCLLAAARAAAGHPVRPTRLDPRARFDPPPWDGTRQRGAWSLVCCPSPYLDAPATTLGLGDSFTAGCLLVLGQQGAGGR